MTALSPFIHFALAFADALDATTDEMPSIADDARITLSALARACQLTAERLKAEEADRERKLMGVA